jgi:hypothetical protein
MKTLAITWGQSFGPAAGPRIPFRGKSILPGAEFYANPTFADRVFREAE